MQLLLALTFLMNLNFGFSLTINLTLNLKLQKFLNFPNPNRNGDTAEGQKFVLTPNWKMFSVLILINYRNTDDKRENSRLLLNNVQNLKFKLSDC